MLRQNEIGKTFYVYMYTSPSGKHYVGRTCTSKECRSKANGRGYEKCTAFWRAIQKYGWDNFKYEVLEENISSENIEEREKYWISFYHSSTDENGYNLLKSHGGVFTASHKTRQKLSESHMGHIPWNKGKTNVYSVETLKRMSDAKKGKYCGEKNANYGKHLSEERKTYLSKYFSKPIMQFDLDGKYITTFQSRKEAAKIVGISVETLTSCLNGKYKTAGGFQWCNVGNEEKIIKNQKILFSKGGRPIPVVQFKNNKIINIFPNIASASRELHVNKKNISLCIKGQKKCTGGFQWFRLSEINQQLLDEYYSRTS